MIRRRGRRRKSEIVNFSIDTKEEHNVTFNTNQVNDVNDRDKNNISFGNMNIVIHSLKNEPFEPIVVNNSINLNSSSSIEKKASSLAPVSSQRCLIKIQVLSRELITTGVSTNFLCETKQDQIWISDMEDYIEEEKRITLKILEIAGSLSNTTL